MVELQWWLRLLGTADPFMLELGALVLLVLAGMFITVCIEDGKNYFGK